MVGMKGMTRYKVVGPVVLDSLSMLHGLQPYILLHQIIFYSQILMLKAMLRVSLL